MQDGVPFRVGLEHDEVETVISTDSGTPRFYSIGYGKHDVDNYLKCICHYTFIVNGLCCDYYTSVFIVLVAMMVSTTDLPSPPEVLLQGVWDEVRAVDQWGDMHVVSHIIFPSVR